MCGVGMSGDLGWLAERRGKQGRESSEREVLMAATRGE